MNDTINKFNVTDRQTFVKFLEILHQDFIDAPESWENNTLSRFLEALSRYTIDIDDYYQRY